jgi:hypothetical protein
MILISNYLCSLSYFSPDNTDDADGGDDDDQITCTPGKCESGYEYVCLPPNPSQAPRVYIAFSDCSLGDYIVGYLWNVCTENSKYDYQIISGDEIEVTRYEYNSFNCIPQTLFNTSTGIYPTRCTDTEGYSVNLVTTFPTNGGEFGALMLL